MNGKDDNGCSFGFRRGRGLSRVEKINIRVFNMMDCIRDPIVVASDDDNFPQRKEQEPELFLLQQQQHQQPYAQPA